MKSNIENLNGILFGNENFGSDYILNFELLTCLKKFLNTSLKDKEMIKFLLCIGECEYDSIVNNELETMECCGLFVTENENMELE